MGIRGLVREALVVVLGYKLVKLWYLGTAVTTDVLVITIVLILFSAWFIAERLGMFA